MGTRPHWTASEWVIRPLSSLRYSVCQSANSQSQSEASTPRPWGDAALRVFLDENSFILITRPLYNLTVEPYRRNPFGATGVPI